MSSLVETAWLVFQATKELGIARIGYYALYTLGIRSGVVERLSRRALKKALRGAGGLEFRPLFEPPVSSRLLSVLGDQAQCVLEEAGEICHGRIRVFGHQVVRLEYDLGKSQDWFTRVEQELRRDQGGETDLKLVWEPARFGWVYTLARAYCIQPEERFAETFWEAIEAFLAHHPPYYGIHWLSAQEVALRLIAWVFGYHVFAKASASTPQRKKRLFEALAVHAARIPCTLYYALAQNNNHLLSEAVGLMTAASVLVGHPECRSWWKRGSQWFLWGIRNQIAEDGTYIQHSTNYHRLVLQLALWARMLFAKQGLSLPSDVSQRLLKATEWLVECCEVSNGCVPNLGPNDGAYIQPLSQAPFQDYRPVLQAAHRAFVGGAVFGKGIWDEMSLWYGVWEGEKANQQSPREEETSGKERLSIRPHSWVMLRSSEKRTWATVRCPRFSSRPTHADLLHLDLWWEGINLACDAGSYRYTAPLPWSNVLAEAFYHNTVTVNGHNPMSRMGKFLWLSWPKTRLIFASSEGAPRVELEHDGYRGLGVVVKRCVTLRANRIWHVQDRIEPAPLCKSRVHRIRLHWLICPCNWQIVPEDRGYRLDLRVNSQTSYLRLRASAQLSLQVVEAGKVVFGAGENLCTFGFCSPSYNLLVPALSVIAEMHEELPVTLETIWELPERP